MGRAKPLARRWWQHPAWRAWCSPAQPQVAKIINRALAAKDGPIVPLIAETGGINAMLVDSTALPEQVADAVMQSAFRSAGQRCSALRLLCVHEEIADGVIAMIVVLRASCAVATRRCLPPMSGR
jgi:RHH-type proline utilization regulon transcriptional repressor/proline dehydrogenase/delta 1-pyrroline-5-carboxylate dehydrogenase